MALITFVYGIKFALRGEELALQQDITRLGDINVTYFNDESTNASMMSFELNESLAFDRAFVTLEELSKSRYGDVADVDLYGVDLFANETMKIVRPVVEKAKEVYGTVLTYIY
jgi:hypothetical protein